MGRVAIIGDIGGHASALRDALVALGMEPVSGLLPEDLTVVQVGDLIHRGPDSSEVLELVAGIVDRQPERWVQLVGNHEGLYLPSASRFSWPESLRQDEWELLQDWWASGRMAVAVALATDAGDVLVTHAGLTAGLWAEIGEPSDVREAVRLLNGLRAADPCLLWRTGRMMDGGWPNFRAGPVWAEAGHEVYASWLARERDGGSVPFGQVHGHSSAYAWTRREWRCSPEVAARFVLVRRARHLRGVLGGQPFIGIDPGFGRRPTNVWAPLVLEHARVVARAPLSG